VTPPLGLFEELPDDAEPGPVPAAAESDDVPGDAEPR
jgi:hypothetical protein